MFVYPSSVVMVACPWEPQSLLGPETRAHATYHQPSCSSTGSSNIMAYFSLQITHININSTYFSLHERCVRTEGKHNEFIHFTWQHSHKPARQSQPVDLHLSRGHLRQVQAQKAAQQKEWGNVFIVKIVI